MLLRIIGEAPQLSKIEEILPSRIEGNSFLELRDAARQLSYDAHIEYLQGQQLTSEVLPGLAYLKPSVDESFKGIGHFGLLITADADVVTFIDGTTGIVERLRRDWYDLHSNGYILRLRPKSNIAGSLQVATMALVVIFALQFVRCVKAHSSK